MSLPFPNSQFARRNWHYDYWYEDVFFELYPEYLAAITKLGW